MAATAVAQPLAKDVHHGRSRFDTLVKSIGTSDTRRALLRFLAALPLSAGLAVLLDAESEAAGRRQRRKARHRHQTGDDKEHRSGPDRQ